MVAESVQYAQAQHIFSTFYYWKCSETLLFRRKYGKAGVPLDLNEYKLVHDNRFDPDGELSFVEWANRRTTTLTMLDCALRSEQFSRMRESQDWDFDTFRGNTYNEKWLPVAVVS